MNFIPAQPQNLIGVLLPQKIHFNPMSGMVKLEIYYSVVFLTVVYINLQNTPTTN